MEKLVLPLLLAFCFSLSAQLSDDFSDGDFTNNPNWIGQTDRFTVTSEELQLNDLNPSGNNISYLLLSAPTADNAETVWEFYLRQEFSPSASNYAVVYLQASNPDLSADQEGYFIRMGGISGDNDALELYRQDGSSSTLLLADTPGTLATNPNEARVRIERSLSGDWTLEVDYTGGEDFETVGTINDLTYTSGLYFGFVCRYTSSRASSFFFDNVLIDPLFVDTEAPTALMATATSATTVEISFDEILDPASIMPADFNIVDGPTISSAQLSGSNPAVVELSLDNALNDGVSYTLNYQDVEDLAGNPATPGSLSFSFVNIVDPGPGDLIVTEFMADPTPEVGLPDAEYIEIHNTTTATLRLGEVGISTGSSPQILPNETISPGEYIILVDDDNVDQFNPLGRVIGLSSLPALTNGGDVVQLSRFGETLFEINYDLFWYKDPSRALGGYSLELIQRSPPYDCIGKWTASEAPAGGSPGQQNSVDGQVLETDGPILLSIFAPNDQTISLQFNENLDPLSAEELTNYVISDGISLLDAMLSSDGRSVTLITNETLVIGQEYQVEISTNIADCLGNTNDQSQLSRVGLSEDPVPGDLLINEVLYYAAVGGDDFVELYNNSNKIININGLRIADIINLNQESISANYLVFPGEYVAITEDPLDVLARYTVVNPLALIQNDLPTLNNELGNVTLFSNTGEVIDAFDYDEAFHNELLSSSRGVSLERIDPDLPTNQAGNWSSAASVVNFGTPTGENSQFRPGGITGNLEDILGLEADRFSPDGDGFEDVLLINYSTDRADYVADIQIFDAQGRLVRNLLNNETLDAGGRIIWDGTANDGRKARLGIYIIFARIFTPGGDTREEKLSCVLAGRLD